MSLLLGTLRVAVIVIAGLALCCLYAWVETSSDRKGGAR